MRLIDVLKMMVDGELKEGTVVRYKECDFVYERLELEDNDGYSIFAYTNDSMSLTEECELLIPT